MTTPPCCFPLTHRTPAKSSFVSFAHLRESYSLLQHDPTLLFVKTWYAGFPELSFVSLPHRPELYTMLPLESYHSLPPK